MEGIEVNETHSRIIIHIDIDYFYAQVEELRDPTLRTKPLGIQQKNIVVTCNYVARGFGIKKLMLVPEALRLCPHLELVKGEDLTPYRNMSTKMFDVLHKFSSNVEKLGMDENFIDVTNAIETRLQEISHCNNLIFQGCKYPEDESFQTCLCGCEKRLLLGSIIAKEMREKLFSELGITSSAGIAHNKLLAKLIGNLNKPNNQTVLVPACASTFLADLENLRNIPGIGQKTESLLHEIGVKSIRELQNTAFDLLQRKFGHETACKLKDLSFGKDENPVRPSGKPKSIGFEDSCKSISVKKDVEEKFRMLLIRLINQVSDDGRIPIAIKIILRKFDATKKTSHRETKQANILPSLFKHKHDGKIWLVEGGQEKLLKIVMRLFERVIDMKQPFNITLLGLAFSKFQERKFGSCSIANFLIKKSDIEVQSVTSLSSDGISSESIRYVNSSPISMEHETISDTSVTSDASEPEIEPSPKKTRIGLLIAKRRCFASHHESMDISSPSKLRVADLRLNSLDRDSPPIVVNNGSGCSELNSTLVTDTSTNKNTMTKVPSSIETTKYPNSVDPDVFKALPPDVQNELIASWTSPVGVAATVAASATKSTKSTCARNTLHRYFITNK